MEDGSGHAVLAYDIIDQPDGSADVLVHDSNVPFDGAEPASTGWCIRTARCVRA